MPTLMLESAGAPARHGGGPGDSGTCAIYVNQGGYSNGGMGVTCSPAAPAFDSLCHAKTTSDLTVNG